MPGDFGWGGPVAGGNRAETHGEPCCLLLKELLFLGAPPWCLWDFCCCSREERDVFPDPRLYQQEFRGGDQVWEVCAWDREVCYMDVAWGLSHTAIS